MRILLEIFQCTVITGATFIRHPVFGHLSSGIQEYVHLRRTDWLNFDIHNYIVDFT
jgi:hypothetical protein